MSGGIITNVNNNNTKKARPCVVKETSLKITKYVSRIIQKYQSCCECLSMKRTIYSEKRSARSH